ncbi:MAG: hypothetical protein ACRD1H_15005, partial [Vicinamibacterales bacterium]
MSLLASADARQAAGTGLVSLAVLAIAGLIDGGPVGVAALALVAVIGVFSPAGTLIAAIAALPFFYRPVGVGASQVAASEVLLLSSAIGTGVTIATGLLRWRRCQSHVRDRLLGTIRSPVFVAVVVLALLGLLLVRFPYDVEHRAESLREWRWT